MQNNSKNAKRSDAKSIYDSPELLNFYIKKTILEYLSDEIIKKAKLGKTEIVIDRSEHVRLKHDDVVLKWFYVHPIHIVKKLFQNWSHMILKLILLLIGLKIKN